MERLTVSKNPHTQSPRTVRGIMLDVCIALLPAFAASIVFFGAQAVLVVLVSVASSFAAEFLFDLCITKSFKKGWIKNLSVWDCSCLVTGMLVAFNVPAAIPLWMVVLGDVFAIVIVKMLFGGIGKNFINPAMGARIFLLISFMSVMTTCTPVSDAFAGMTNYSSATWLGSGATMTGTSIPIPPRSGHFAGSEWLAMFLGCKASCAMGETSILALLIGFVYLSVRKVIDPRFPLTIILSAAIFAFFFDALPNATGADVFNVVVGHVLNGGLMLGAVFMATDYSTSPNTYWGNVIFCVGIGFFAVLIRVFGTYPEGMSFAILIMNVLVPLIDKYVVPKPFGFRKIKTPKEKAERVKKEKKTKNAGSAAAIDLPAADAGEARA